MKAPGRACARGRVPAIRAACLRVRMKNVGPKRHSARGPAAACATSSLPHPDWKQAGKTVKGEVIHHVFWPCDSAWGGCCSRRCASVINVAGASSWPIVEVTYVLLDRQPKSPQRARSTLKFFFWAFLQGDQMAAETGFVPLPPFTQARVVGRFRDVLAPDKSPIDFLK